MKDARPGVAETFGDHEIDTAQRGYPNEMVEGTKRTARMPRVELEAILEAKSGKSGKSGTRPATSDEEIAEHMRARLSSIATPFVELTPQSLPAVEADLHARPTIAESLHITPRASVPAPAPVAPRAGRVGRIVTFVLVALGSGTIGFVLGRRPHR